MQKRNIEQVKKEVENFKQSGLSKKDYCQKQGISFNSLQWTITRLNRHEKKPGSKEVIKKSGFTCFELVKPIETKPIMVHYGPAKIELPDNFSEQSFRKIISTIRKCHA